MDILVKITLPRLVQPLLFLSDREVKRINHIAEVKEFVSGLFTKAYREELAMNILYDMESYDFSCYAEMFKGEYFDIIAPYIITVASEYYDDMAECQECSDMELYFELKKEYLKIKYLLNLYGHSTTQQLVTQFLGAAKKAREGNTIEYSMMVDILKAS